MKNLFILTIICFCKTIAVGQTVVKLIKKNGIYSVPCEINGKLTSFYFDTGASDLTISINFFKDAVEQGILEVSDLLPEIVNYKVANGEVSIGRRINIRELKIGNLLLENILATVVADSSAPLLLGQSVLKQFGSYTIDNTTSTLIITGNYKSNLDLALTAAKKEMAERMKSNGDDKDLGMLNQQIDQTKIDILHDMEVASGLEYDVSSIVYNKNNDNEITFKYDITNNSSLNYQLKAYSQLSIVIDVFTASGKVYSTSTSTDQMLIGNTVNGHDLTIKLRDNVAIYFRIYAIVNGPLLSTLENN